MDSTIENTSEYLKGKYNKNQFLKNKNDCLK